MCSDCHSTNVRKNYDEKTNSYNTKYALINVSCEACHGPGKQHVEDVKRLGDNYKDSGTMHMTLKTTPKKLVDECARCHLRREQFSKSFNFKGTLLDHYFPQIIEEGLYYPDGQILEEDYVYGSFVQSKMYRNNISCNNCHDSHSLKLKFDGNALCAQCHIPEKYNIPQHHFHKMNTDGAMCINCHMPERTYMGIDQRSDHSMRIPRPDLTIKLGTPNACQDCHSDKSADWSQNYIEQWYGKNRRSHYAEVFARASALTLNDPQKLKQLMNPDLYPDMVRATAVHYMANYNDSTLKTSMKVALADAEAVVRLAAIRNYQASTAAELKKLLLPLLRDPLKAIRINTANRLLALDPGQFNNNQRKLLDQVLDEYVASQNYTADFATTQHNLGLYYSNRNQLSKSMQHYQEALNIDKDFFPARVNLAMLQYNNGQLDKALQSFIYLRDHHHDFAESWYYLGLLYAEQQQYKLAAEHLEKALQVTPQNGRIAYNLGLIYQMLQQTQKAEKTLLYGFEQSGGSYDYAFALADLYLKTGNAKAAQKYAGQMLQKRPNDPAAVRILQMLKEK